jgi:DHA3 family macrolide efflux protein-like MFS transporter
LLFAVVAVGILTVPLAGGRLLNFASLHFRRTPLLLGAFGVQFAIFKLWPQEADWYHPLLYLASYGLGLAFLVLNRRVPGLWLIGVGAACNGLAIAANGGVMPGSTDAFVAAGLVPAPETFVNSRALSDPNLLFLGDVFAVPSWLPFHNVFSLGDLCIVIGAFVGLHRVSGSRLLPSGSGQFAVLLAERDFRRLWLAQAVSNQGDWVYSLGVVAGLARRSEGPGTLALLVVMQAAPRAVAGLFGGPLVDRLPRKRLMITADLVRAAAVGSLLLMGTPSLGHLYLVAACLGLFAALFQPSLQASIPNVVPEHRLVAANALVSVTFQLAVMVGPVVGALLVAHLGLAPAFAVNAASFLVSAALVSSMRLPHRAPASPRASALADLREGFRYASSTPMVRGILLVTGMVMFAAAIRGPLEPLFVLQVLHADIATLGLPAAIWGLGMLLGSSAAPAAAKVWSRERMLTVSIGLVGVSVLGASQSQVLSSLLCLWLVAGSGNAIGTIAYQSLLQQRTPDEVRGRTMAASETVLDIAYLAGVSVAGWLGGHLGLRWALGMSGALFLGAAVTSWVVLGTRRSTATEPQSTMRSVPRPASRAASRPPSIEALRAEVEYLRRREEELRTSVGIGLAEDGRRLLDGPTGAGEPALVHR